MILRWMLIPAVLVGSLLLAGCAGIRSTPQYGPSQDNIVNLDEVAARFQAAKNNALTSSAAIPEYLDAGASLSNTACDIWLDQLGHAERNTNLGRDLMNVVGTLILGISGINGADSTSLARGALILTGANAVFDVYRADILMGSIDQIAGKVREDRIVAERSLLGSPNITYDAATRRIMEYHKLCSAERIKTLLNTSLAAAKFAPPDTTLASAVDKAKATVLVTTLKATLGSVDLLLADQNLLYQTWLAVVVYPKDEPNNPEVARNARANGIVAIYLAALAQKSASVPDVKTTLQEIAVLLRFGDQLKADLAAEAARQKLDALNQLRDAELAFRRAASDVTKQQGEVQPLIASAAFDKKSTVEIVRIVKDMERAKRPLVADSHFQVLRTKLDDFERAQQRFDLAETNARLQAARIMPPVGVTPTIIISP